MNLYIDATWYTPKDKSNVYRFHQKYGGHYFAGPGTKGFFLERLFGGAFGSGSSDIAEKVYQTYLENYTGGEINIIAASRGAAIARMVAAKLAEKGTVVNFIGCFDTVGAFGIPVNFLFIPSKYLPKFLRFQEINLFTDMKVHESVKRAAHAMALDEDRHAFQNTPMEPREGIVQKGFRGDHEKIITGDETFNWMVEQFETP